MRQIISLSDKNQIMNIFVLINQVLPYENRRRMINIHFILKKIFEMKHLSNDHLKVSKSKKTLNAYEDYWNTILHLKSDEINKIIKH